MGALGAPVPIARHRTIDSPHRRGPMSDDPRSDLKGTSYELFMLLLSLLAFANVFIVLIAGPVSVAGEVAILIEIAITPFFLFDFAVPADDGADAVGLRHPALRLGGSDRGRAAPALLPAAPGLERDPGGAGRRHGAPGRRPLRQPRVRDVPARPSWRDRGRRVRRDRRVLRGAGACRTPTSCPRGTRSGGAW